MQRDPLASSKARKAERKADEKSGLITIKPVKLDSQPTSIKGGGFKKGGFKNAFGSADDEKAGKDGADGQKNDGGLKQMASGKEDIKIKEEFEESDSDDEYEHYDPSHPTDCFEGCAGRHKSLS